MHSNNNSLTEIAQIIKKFDNFLILAHENPDADAYSSAAAMSIILSKMGKKFHTYVTEPVPYNLQVVNLQRFVSTDREKFVPQIIIFLDCADMRRSGEDMERQISGLKEVSTINLDHHISNPHFADYNFVNLQASSTAEIVYQLANSLNIQIDQTLATTILTGIAYDTGFLQFRNTFPSTLRIVADLVEAGADYSKVFFETVKDFSVPTLKIFGESLVDADSRISGKILFVKRSFLGKGKEVEEFKKVRTWVMDILLRSVDCEASVYFYEQTAGSIRISFRSRGDIDCARTAEHFGGGGHKDAAGALVQGDLDEVAEEVLSYIESNYEVLQQ